jgi:hypothetical protein
MTVSLFFYSEFFKRNRPDIKYLILSICVTLYCINTAFAQTENEFDFERIEDNSFLIEEAYNQDPGVIQHISAFQYMRDKNWVYTFTDEWPVPGQKHQLSITIPVLRTGETSLGDVELNYRYQAIFLDRLAFSPRLSFLLPSGNYKKELGSGVPGYQLSLPFSYLLSRKVVTHYNLGLTITPNAKNADGSKSDLTIFNYGLSVILLFNKNFNFMLEVVGNTTFIKAANINTRVSSSVFINPGFRWAINYKSGLQIVPGLAIPVGLGSAKGESGVFAYLSFEHPLWKPKN